MKIAIVEDKPEDQKCLSDLLAEDARGRGWTYTVETYTSGEAFLEAAGNFDIVFLDVLMDGIDGLETAQRFHEKGGSALVVFVTVEAEFALDGYDVDAVAFLVKPTDAKKFHRTMDRLEQKLMAREHKSWVVLSHDNKIPAGVVMYATIEDHYLKVYTDGEMLSPHLSMEEFRTRLPDDGRFIECSRGVVVNLDHVSKVAANSLTMTMYDGTRLHVSRRRRQALVSAIATRKFSIARGDTP